MVESQTIEERIASMEEEIKKAESFIPYGKFKQGENKLVIDTQAGVIENISKYGRQSLYVANLNGEKVKIALPKSVEMLVLSGLRKNRTSFTVTKTGEGMQTRYRVK